MQISHKHNHIFDEKFQDSKLQIALCDLNTLQAIVKPKRCKKKDSRAEINVLPFIWEEVNKLPTLDYISKHRA